MKKNTLLILILLSWALARSLQAFITLTPLGDLPGGDFYSFTSDVSADGSVVTGSGKNEVDYEAFIWTESEGMIGLGFLPGGVYQMSFGSAISADGKVVVGSSFSDRGYEAFRWDSDSGMIGLGDLSGGVFSSGATGVNQDGSVVVGSSKSSNGEESFIWNELDGMVGMGGLPDSNNTFFSSASAVSADGKVVVGSASPTLTNRQFKAYYWESGSNSTGLIQLLDSSFDHLENTAGGISPDGKYVAGVVGGVPYILNRDKPVLTPLALLPGAEDSYASDLSADGEIIVGRVKVNDRWTAVIWVKQGEIYWMSSLNDLFDDLGINRNGFSMNGISSISGDGSTIVGEGVNSEGHNEAFHLRMEMPLLWADYPIQNIAGDVNTGPWLGWVNVNANSWIYAYSLQSWMYPHEPGISDKGGWFFIPR